MVAWEEVNAIEALRELPCGWLDWGCYLSNAAKWLLKGILTPVFFIKNLLLGVAYYIIAGVVQVGKFIAVGFLRYVLKPVAYTVAWIIDRIRESLKTVFCYYLRLAQVGTVVKEVAFGKGTLGRRIMKGIAKLVGFYVLTAIVARECTLVPVEVNPVISPPTAVSVVPTPVATPYVGNASIHLDVYEYMSIGAVYLGIGRVDLRATESVSAFISGGSATVRLEATESVSAFISSGSATVTLNATEAVVVYVLKGAATVWLSATESISLTVFVGIAEVKLEATESVSAFISSGSATVRLEATEAVVTYVLKGAATVRLDAMESAMAVGPGVSAIIASAYVIVS
jgi:opacity protein-like surface antigen